jgi:rhamnogalacturonyl hydrolase YesR
MLKTSSIVLLLTVLPAFQLLAQNKATDATAPLHAMKVDYPTPYLPPATADVKKVLDRVYNYLDATTPAQFVNRKTGETVSNLSAIDTNTVFKQGDFRLNSYEWGVTYAGMLEVGQATGDAKYTNYTKTRLEFLANAFPAFKSLLQKNASRGNPLRGMIEPHALDDAGAMSAATTKLLRAGGAASLRPVIDNFMDFISNKEYRLADKTLGRNRPQKNTLWLDDLYMSVPALAQMGKLTGDAKYYDDAVRQVLQFSQRMFNKEKGVYMHGWVEGMDVHPQFHWGRANGWAFLAMTELLDVLPENHSGRQAVLDQYKALAKGLVAYQSSKGFWHQLLDRNDSYLETSATAIYTYCLARGINKGYLNAMAFGPATVLAWNAVATKVNDKGQVEGTCVGTGMAFDPAFYYYRPVNVYAAHGYGPVLLAGAEIINLLKTYTFEMNDSALQVKLK